QTVFSACFPLFQARQSVQTVFPACFPLFHARQPVQTAANLGAVSIAEYYFHPDSENAQSFSTGWFSFSKNVDNTIVSFRVTFEMDFFGVDRKDEIRQGRIDFTSKTKIIGEEYLR
ncbi:MAG: hypothetical protein II809_00005, partial [Bacteroidales bacterium]|nr:hypothetical protein [Bacteroidales bacterium]